MSTFTPMRKDVELVVFGSDFRPGGRAGGDDMHETFLCLRCDGL